MQGKTAESFPITGKVKKEKKKKKKTVSGISFISIQGQKIRRLNVYKQYFTRLQTVCSAVGVHHRPHCPSNITGTLENKEKVKILLTFSNIGASYSSTNFSLSILFILSTSLACVQYES